MRQLKCVNVKSLRTLARPKQLPTVKSFVSSEQRGAFCQHRFYTKKIHSGNEEFEKDIEELKVMFKDDPLLETWLKELDSKNEDTESQSLTSSSNISTATDLDREMLRYNIEEFYESDNDRSFTREVEQEEEPLPISTERMY